MIHIIKTTNTPPKDLASTSYKNINLNQIPEKFKNNLALKI